MQVIFIVSIICLTLAQVVSTEKYLFDGKCKADQLEDGYYRDLTFICDSTTWVKNCSFPKESFCTKKIRKISFENCMVVPVTFDEIFLHNVINLDMSDLGMTTDLIRFLAEPNDLSCKCQNLFFSTY